MALTICSLASGSSGNATWISTGRTSLLVDCGASAREVTSRLCAIGTHPSRLDGILITHAHSDHYRSAGTLNARWGVPVFVDPAAARALARRGRHTSWRRLRETRPLPDRLGDLEILALDTTHGFPPEEGRTVSFRFESNGSRAAVVTDLGTASDAMLEALRGVGAIVLEANYDEATVSRKLSDPAHASDWHYLNWVRSPYGHLSNGQCAEVLEAVLDGSPCHVFLGHMSDNHPDPRRDNNGYVLALGEVTRRLERARVPLPTLHRTWRIGRVPCVPGPVVQV